MTKDQKALLDRVNATDKYGGVEVTTLGVENAIAKGATAKEMLLDHSVDALCRALALRGYDVKAMQPDEKKLRRRIEKHRKQSERARKLALKDAAQARATWAATAKGTWPKKYIGDITCPD